MKEQRLILFAFGIIFAIAYLLLTKPIIEPLEGGNIQKAEFQDSLINEIDSLKHEPYVTQTIVDRYEIAIEINRIRRDPDFVIVVMKKEDYDYFKKFKGKFINLTGVSLRVIGSLELKKLENLKNPKNP